MTQLALRTTVILLIALTALALWQMREAVQLLAVAVAVAAGLTPLVDRISARGIPRPRAAGLVFGGGIIVVALLLTAYGALIAVELAALAESLPLGYLRARQSLEAAGGWMAALAELLPSNTAITAAMLGGESALGQTLLGAAAGALGAIVLTISVASLGFYWLVEEQRFTRLWLSLLPLGTRTRVRAVWGEISKEIGIYVRGVAIVVALTTLALLSIYTLIGVPGAALLALLGGLAMVVPLLGPPLAVVPGVLVALSQGQVAAGLALIGGIFAVAVVRFIITPRLYREGIAVNPVLVVVVIMALAEIGGVPLVLLGPPVAAALQASTRALIQHQRSATPQAQADRIGGLEERLAAITAQIDPDDSDAPRLQGMVERARRLLAEARAA
jgi:predicted PurR-regulated permease PerM